MITSIQSIHFDADVKLIATIEKKLQQLKKYFSQQSAEIKVYLKLEKVGQVQDKIIEILVHLPGHYMMVKSTSKSFEAALREAIQSLKNQIRKHKEKIQKKY